MNAAGRRCRQFANGFAHISGKRRPVYKKTGRSVAEAIAAERNAAARLARMGSKPKKGKQ